MIFPLIIQTIIIAQMVSIEREGNKRHRFNYRPNNNNLYFNEAGDDGVTVSSAGPYANHLYLAKDR